MSNRQSFRVTLKYRHVSHVNANGAKTNTESMNGTNITIPRT